MSELTLPGRKLLTPDLRQIIFYTENGEEYHFGAVSSGLYFRPVEVRKSKRGEEFTAEMARPLSYIHGGISINTNEEVVPEPGDRMAIGVPKGAGMGIPDESFSRGRVWAPYNPPLIPETIEYITLGGRRGKITKENYGELAMSWVEWIEKIASETL